MGKGIAALAHLPQVDIILPAGNAATSVEAFKALAFKIAQMQAEGLGNGTYNGEIAVGADPYFSSVWNITVADAGETFTCVLVSDDNPDGGAQGRAALSTRRAIDITKLTSVNNASVRSFLAVLAFIERLEDKVAATGVGTSGDLTAQTISLRGTTPFESFEWTITKADAAYTLVTTANS